MSVVILGGNECMERQYKDLCKQYNCRAKVFCKMKGMKAGIGNPDMIVLFTDTISHKMVQCAMSELKGSKARIVRSHSSSRAALKAILSEHAAVNA